MGNFAILHNDQTHQRLEVKLRRELGDLVMGLLLDERVEDILLNPDSALWVKRMGRDFTKVGAMAAETALSALSTSAAWRGTVLNHDNPIPRNRASPRRQSIRGHRLAGCSKSGLCNSVTTEEDLFARRLSKHRDFDDKRRSTQQIPQTRRFSASARGLSHAEIIRAAVFARKNILVVGATGSGKTTLVNAILHAFAMLTPYDRVISIEDTTELQCPVSNYLDLRAVGQVSMLDCLRACMRLKPTRIVVGEAGERKRTRS